MTPEERAEARRIADNTAARDQSMLGARLVAALNALEAAERARDEAKSHRDEVVETWKTAAAQCDTARARLAEVEQARDWIREESDNRAALLIAARAQVATLVEALEWYANKENWDYPYSDDMEPGDICERGALVDLGERARAALKAAGVET